MPGPPHNRKEAREATAVAQRLRARGLAWQELEHQPLTPRHAPPVELPAAAVDRANPVEADLASGADSPGAAFAPPPGRQLTRRAGPQRGMRGQAITAPSRKTAGAMVLSALRWLFFIKPKVLIIERYLWAETFGHFLLGAMGFTFFMVITTIFALGEKIFSKNIPPFTIAKVLLLSAPSFLVLAIPVAVVFSTLMAMGRLNRDNEIIAMQTNGISLYRIFIPFITLAMMAGILSWVLFEKVVPPNATEYIGVLKVFWQAQVVDFIKPGIVISAPQKKYFYVDEIRKEPDEDGVLRSTMYNIRLYDYYREGSGGLRPYPRIFVAKRAWVEEQYLVLSEVTLYNLDERTGKNLVSASMNRVEIDIATKIVDYSLDPQPQQLTWRELRDRVHRMRDRIASAGFLRSSLQNGLLMNWTEYYMKFSIPFACISFVLVAVPVSLRGPRDERNLGLILTFGLVMAYYIIFFTARTLGSRGVLLPGGLHLAGLELLPNGFNMLPPYIAGWLAPGMFILASIPLLIKARK